MQLKHWMILILVMCLAFGYLSWLLREPPIIVAIARPIVVSVGVLVSVWVLLALLFTWYEDTRRRDY